jgi:predicted nucleic-acid-binding protein
MKITADTNVLVRAIVGDDAPQSRIAHRELNKADLVALALPALCELAWVLSRGYKIPSGLALLVAGGDFADGVIGYEGNWLGADVFVSFDRKAVKLMGAQGGSAQLLT